MKQTAAIIMSYIASAVKQVESQVVPAFQDSIRLMAGNGYKKLEKWQHRLHR
jgi:hypothetical protein